MIEIVCVRLSNYLVFEYFSTLLVDLRIKRVLNELLLCEQNSLLI